MWSRLDSPGRAYRALARALTFVVSPETPVTAIRSGAQLAL
jgi:hypothetical protein